MNTPLTMNTTAMPVTQKKTRVIKEDERQRMIRYRAGFYAFVAMAGACYLYYLSGLFLDEHLFTISAGDLMIIAFWFAFFGLTVFNVFHRTVAREVTEELRHINNDDTSSRRRRLVLLISMALLGGGGMLAFLLLVTELEVRNAVMISSMTAAFSVLFTYYSQFRSPSSEQLDEDSE